MMDVELVLEVEVEVAGRFVVDAEAKGEKP